MLDDCAAVLTDEVPNASVLGYPTQPLALEYRGIVNPLGALTYVPVFTLAPSWPDNASNRS